MANPRTVIFHRPFMPVAKPSSQGLPSYSGNVNLTKQLTTYKNGAGFRGMPESGALPEHPHSLGSI